MNENPMLQFDSLVAFCSCTSEDLRFAVANRQHFARPNRKNIGAPDGECWDGELFGAGGALLQVLASRGIERNMTHAEGLALEFLIRLDNALDELVRRGMVTDMRADTYEHGPFYVAETPLVLLREEAIS